MATLVLDPHVEAYLRGLDRDTRYDEVWEGMSVFMPPRANRDTRIAGAVVLALHLAVEEPELGRVASGGNVSDRDADWAENYRIPDALVYLHSNPALNRETHYVGGPDFALEVVSQGEDGTAKLGFYAAVNTREVLVIDRDPWALTLYRLAEGTLTPVAAAGGLRTSESTGVTFALETAGERPVVVATTPGGKSFRA